MKNLGPKSTEWLTSIGIFTIEDVEKIGVVETYKRVKAAYPEKVSLNMLYGLQAAVMNINWKDLPLDIKEDLKRQVEE
jgi:DNA transformation protein and related proteins